MKVLLTIYKCVVVAESKYHRFSDNDVIVVIIMINRPNFDKVEQLLYNLSEVITLCHGHCHMLLQTIR